MSQLAYGEFFISFTGEEEPSDSPDKIFGGLPVLTSRIRRKNGYKKHFSEQSASPALFCEDNLVEESESKLDEWFLTKKC